MLSACKFRRIPEENFGVSNRKFIQLPDFWLGPLVKFSMAQSPSPRREPCLTLFLECMALRLQMSWRYSLYEAISVRDVVHLKGRVLPVVDLCMFMTLKTKNGRHQNIISPRPTHIFHALCIHLSEKLLIPPGVHSFQANLLCPGNSM